MPYSISDPPAKIKDLPKHAQEIWIAAYNAAIKEYEGDEAKANATAWAAVKSKYEQDKDGKWIAKKSENARMQYGELIKLAETVDSKAGFRIVQILRAGEFVDMNGKDVDVTSDDLDTYVANSNAELSKNELAVELGHPEDAGAPAAGWYRQFFKKMIDGVDWVCAKVELSALGIKSLEDQLYKYFSGSLDLAEKAIFGGGFVNRPAISGQQPVGSLARYLHPRSARSATSLTNLEMSYEDLRNKLSDALSAKYQQQMQSIGNSGPWIVATFPDKIICQKGEDYYEIPFTIENDEVVFGDPTPVEMNWTPKADNNGGQTQMNKQQPLASNTAIDLRMALEEAEKRGVALGRHEFAYAQQKLSEAERRGRETALAEAKRSREIAEFAHRVTNAGTKVLPQKQEDIIALLNDAPSEDYRLRVQAFLQGVAQTGLADLSEIGSSLDGQGNKELANFAKPLLRQWIKKGRDIAEFFDANPELGKMNEYDLAEFVKLTDKK